MIKLPMKLLVIKEFREIYDESGITTIFAVYVRRMAITLLVAFTLTATFTGFLHKFWFNLPFQRWLIVVITLSFVVTNFVAFLHLFYPFYCRNQNRQKVENGIVYSLSYMTVLSTSGISIERIMERVSEVEENPIIKRLATKFIMNIKMFGLDVYSALEDIAHKTPSKNLKKLLTSIIHNVRSSGDLKSLLNYEVKRQFQLKRESLKKLMGTLTYVGEMYVALMVVGPILFILMITILSIFDVGLLGASSVIQLNLLVFFGIPILASGLAIVLDTMLEGGE